MGQSISTAGGAVEHGEVHARREHQVITEDGRAVEPGSGEIGPGRRRRLPARRLLQGPGEVGGHLHHDRRARATRCPGDFAKVEADGTLTLLGPRVGVHQHRRREGLPRGGRGGAQDPPGGAPTPWPSACPTRSSARPSPPSSSRRPAPSSTRRRHRPREGEARLVQGAQARRRRRHDRPGPERQGRLQAPQGLRDRAARALTRSERRRRARSFDLPRWIRWRAPTRSCARRVRRRPRRAGRRSAAARRLPPAPDARRRRGSRPTTTPRHDGRAASVTATGRAPGPAHRQPPSSAGTPSTVEPARRRDPGLAVRPDARRPRRRHRHGLPPAAGPASPRRCTPLAWGHLLVGAISHVYEAELDGIVRRRPRLGRDRRPAA